MFLKILVRKEEVAAVLAKLRAFRAEVDKRFDALETRIEAGFRELHQAIDRLGARWGIRNESLFRHQNRFGVIDQPLGTRLAAYETL